MSENSAFGPYERWAARDEIDTLICVLNVLDTALKAHGDFESFLVVPRDLPSMESVRKTMSVVISRLDTLHDDLFLPSDAEWEADREKDIAA